MKKQNILLIFVLSLFPVFTIKAQNVDVSKLPTVEVMGKAEIQVVPDEVEFLLVVRKSDKSLQVAKAQNDENVKEILDLVKRFGIAPQDVKTNYISVNEKYDRIKLNGEEEEYKSVFAGYTVSKTIVIRLKDISKFESFFSEIIGIGVTEVSNVSFKSSQLRKYKDEARAQAIRAAKEKAEALAKEIGQTIGKAVSIEEIDADNSSDTYNYSYSPNANSNVRYYDPPAERDSTVSVGTISIIAKVQVNFLLY